MNKILPIFLGILLVVAVNDGYQATKELRKNLRVERLRTKLAGLELAYAITFLSDCDKAKVMDFYNSNDKFFQQVGIDF